MQNDVCFMLSVSRYRETRWQVLDWNESAIKFYEKHEAEISREWFNGRFNWE